MNLQKTLKLIKALNRELDALEREKNVYFNLLGEDIGVETEEFIVATLQEINEDIVYLQKLQEEVLNGNEDNS
ncbi:MAG: hypothetical protein [Bacteriophage sp.]|nr:MAG: hypothetical protein [Bacteriophage sp.]